MATPSREQIAAMQRKYSGLDDQLHYVPGHTITQKYGGYKAADEAAGAAAAVYKRTAVPLRKEKPDATDRPKPTAVAGGRYYPESHRILAPLAGGAANAAAYHGDRRDSFNNRYEDLLRVKGVYDSHATEAAKAYANERKYRGWERKHAQYGSQS